jgi:hypothetical protein
LDDVSVPSWNIIAASAIFAGSSSRKQRSPADPRSRSAGLLRRPS